jgi:hypothetical protein
MPPQGRAADQLRPAGMGAGIQALLTFFKVRKMRHA